MNQQEIQENVNKTVKIAWLSITVIVEPRCLETINSSS